MTNLAKRASLAALVLLVAAPAAAHEFECERTIGLVVPGQLDSSGLPVFAAPPAPVLSISTYPALVGFRVVLTNVALDASAIGATSEPLLDGKAGTTVYGAALAPGDVLATGASATRVVVVTVASYADCLALGGTPDLACRPAGTFDDRFVVTHDFGESECRARLLCAQ